MTQTKYDKAVSVCFSGHRNIPFLYRKQLKLQLKAAITKAYAGGYRHFYCGCAMGFDMLAAEVALALQSELSGLQVIAVVPLSGGEYLPCKPPACFLSFFHSLVSFRTRFLSFLA